MRSRSVLLTASLLLTIGMFVAGTAGAAKVKLSTAKAKPVKILGTAEYQYSSDSIIWFECRKRTKPLMVGWSGPNAPLSIIYTHAYNTSGQVALAVRKPARTGKFKSFARCAGGPIAAKAKQAPKRVQCGKKQVAIGAPIDGGPYYQESVFSKPIGTRGWANNESASSSAKVICASKKAFKRANLAKRSTTFKPNARTVTVTAKCKGGRVPISWGFVMVSAVVIARAPVRPDTNAE